MKNYSIIILIILFLAGKKTYAQDFELYSSEFQSLSNGAIACCDFDKDGDNDFFISGKNSIAKGVSKLYVNNSGKFTEFPYNFVGIKNSSAIWEDFNGDSSPELLITGTTNEGTNLIRIYQYINGTFVEMKTKLEPLSHGSLSVADFNNDKKMDILLTGKDNSGKEISAVYQNGGDFLFTKNKTDFPGFKNSASVFCDFDGDNLADILIAGDSGNKRITKLFKNNGNGSFTEKMINLPGLAYPSIASTDYDNDGDQDIFITGIDANSNPISNLYINDGKANFTTYSQKFNLTENTPFFTPTAYGMATWGDIDGDSDLDLIVSGKSIENITLVYLNGKGNFTKTKTIIPSFSDGMLCLANTDADSKMDIIISGLSSGSKLQTSIYRNAGNSSTRSIESNQANALQADFDATAELEGGITKFSNKSTSSIQGKISYHWDFGDGTSADEENANHKYAKPGKYNAVLTVTAGNSTKTISKTVIVRSKNFEIYKFSDKEQMVLQTEAIGLLKTYEEITNKLANLDRKTDETKIKQQIESLLSMFISRNVYVYNDLDPDGKLAKYFEAEIYINNLVLFFPQGLKVKLSYDNATVSGMTQYGADLFSVDIIVKKSNNGFYMGEKDNKIAPTLIFKIAFSKEGNNLKNYKIVGIREAYTGKESDDPKNLFDIKSAKLNDSETKKIQKDAIALLNDYIRNLKFITNQNEADEDKDIYQETFLNFFTSENTKLLNDIEPEPTDEFITPQKYISTFRTNYTDGIVINLKLDTVEYRPIVEIPDQKKYTISIITNKIFEGKFNKKTKQKFSEKMTFKIVFDRVGNAFQNYRIDNIDRSSLDFYQQSYSLEADSVERPIRTIGWKGWNIGISAGGVRSMLVSNNLINNSSLNVNEGLEGWKIKPSLGYGASINLGFNITDKIGFVSGIGFQYFKTSYSINGEYLSSTLEQDLNYKDNPKPIYEYYKRVTVTNYDSSFSTPLIEIPVMVSYFSKNPGNIGFYAQGGLNFSLMFLSKYSTTGNYNLAGYYPNEIPELQIRDTQVDPQWSALGFYHRDNINQIDQKPDFKPYCISAIFSGGVIIPLSYFSTLMVGPEIRLGLSEVSNTGFTNIFNNPAQQQKTVIRSYGIRLSLTYRI